MINFLPDTKFNKEAVGCLCNAIVMQASEDYFTCKRMIEKGKNRYLKISDCTKTLAECIDFFNSDWYKTLTNNDTRLAGNLVMQRLDEMVADKDTYPKDYKPFKYNEEDED